MLIGKFQINTKILTINNARKFENRWNEDMKKEKQPIRLRPECISCMIKSKIDMVPEGISVEEKVEYMQRVLKEIAELPKHHSAPVAVRGIYRIQKEMFGFEENYSEIKSHFNQLMMEKEPKLWENIQKSDDKLKLAIQYAMTGNYIDFGAMNHVDEAMLEQFFEDAKKNPVNESEYTTLKKEIEQAEKIVFLHDNCGEIVVDKLLIQEIKELNPDVQITSIVRGYDVVNDATIEDAEQIGLTKIVNVIGNGSNIGGTCLEEISEEASEFIDSADVVLAKGQGNFETMQNCGKNIYYIFMCKCEMFANRFHVPKYCGMLINDKNL